MNKLFILYILQSFLIKSFSQLNYSGIDISKKQLAQITTDTAKLRYLNYLAETAPEPDWQYFNKELKTLALKNIKETKKSTLIPIYIKYFSTSINNDGFIYQNEGFNTKAIKCYNISLKLSEYINDGAGVATALNNIGSIYERTGKTDSAILFYTKSLNICNKIDDYTGASNSLSNIGSIYNTTGNINQALNYYNKALQKSIKINDIKGEAITLSKIAEIHFNIEEYKDALKFCRKSLSLARQSGDSTLVGELLNPIGAMYFKSDKLNEANQHYLNGLKINYFLKNQFGIGTSLVNIGLVLGINKNYNEAIDSLSKALEIFKAIDSDMQVDALEKLATIYTEQQDFFKAKKYLLQALDIAKQSGNVNHIITTSNSLVDIYKKNGEYELALNMQSLYLSCYKKTINDEIKKEIIQTQYEYEYNKKSYTDSIKKTSELKIYDLKLKQEKTNIYLLLLGIACLVLSGLFVIQRYSHTQKQKVLQLRNKIASDLHDDIGSALSSIKMLATISKTNPQKAKEANLIHKIEETSLDTINSMNDIIWSINTKNDNFSVMHKKMYEFIENICTASNINFEFIVTGEITNLKLDTIERKNLYLIFKEAVNNAVKYAQCDLIKVEISKTKKQITLNVTDNGIGFSTNFDNNKGNGLDNMKRRADEIKGIIIINSNSKGTSIALSVNTI